MPRQIKFTEEQIITALKRFSEVDARRTRCEHAAALATQIAAPDGLLVEEQLGKLMKSWPELERDFPEEALALEPLRKSWLDKHPGPKTKKTKPAETPETPTTRPRRAAGGEIGPASRIGDGPMHVQRVATAQRRSARSPTGGMTSPRGSRFHHAPVARRSARLVMR